VLGKDDDVLVREEPEVAISEEGSVRSGHVEVPTGTAIPIVSGNLHIWQNYFTITRNAIQRVFG